MSASVTMEDFETLLNESFELDVPKEGSVVKGTVIAIEAGQAIIDIGFKMEGRVELKEFANPGEAPEIIVDDKVEVYLERVENSKGEAVISRETARRDEAWDRMEKAYRAWGSEFTEEISGLEADMTQFISLEKDSTMAKIIYFKTHSRQDERKTRCSCKMDDSRNGKTFK